MQSSFYIQKRMRLCGWLNEISKPTYTKWFKRNKQPWNININDLQQFNPRSLGQNLFLFLTNEGFNIMDKHESHDVFHLLTNYGTSKKDEIAMQCFLFGNGKKTVYTLFSIGIGVCILPEFYRCFYKAYLRGKEAFPMYYLNYKPLLNYPLHHLKWILNITPL